MTPVLLIAGNFLREQRWLAVLLVLYAFGGAAVFGYSSAHVAAEDVVFFVDQQAAYAVLFSLFSGAWAIQNERKTRRIIAVLSKAITRRQYLAGLVSGVSTIFLLYCASIGVAGMWLMRRSLWHPRDLWILLACTVLAALLTAALTIFYATFMIPLFAMGAAGLTLGLPALLEHALGSGWANLVPVYALARVASDSSLPAHRIIGWTPVLIAVLEILLLWVAAAWIFERRDVTVAVE